MMRKLTVLLLSGTICLLGITPILAAKYSEAPMLRTMVAAGELPPIEERLPKEPVVVEPVEEIGQYGGTWTQCMTNPRHIGLVIGTYSYELPVVWNRGMTEIVPNVFKSWEISEDRKTFTFHLRKGMKWSDGYLFTAEDIRFWYEDIALNKELGTPDKWLPEEVQKIDDYTVAFRFVEPPGLFLEETAYGRKFWLPAHYLKQFHPAYTPMEKLEKKFKEEGYLNWVDLFITKLAPYSGGIPMGDTECPTLDPWVLKTNDPTATRQLFERNPYYWKVDPAGNQLPYLDRAIVNIVADAEMISLKAMTGEANFQSFFTNIGSYSLYVENQERGNYRVLLWPTDKGAAFGLFLNQNVEGEVLRKVIRDVRFRRALSLAIDREAINQTCYLGLGVPRQATVISASPLYKEEYAKAYAQYDLQRANTLLDEIGLTERDKDGFRLRPDGKTLSLIMGYYARATLAQVDALEMIKENWKSIGIKVLLRSAETALTQKRFSDGELSIIIHDAFDAYYPIYPRILWFVPVVYYTTPRDFSAPGWGPQYAHWYVTGGKEGEEPPPEIKRLYDIWEEIKVTIDPEKRKELFQEILKANAENVYPMGAVGEVPQVLIVANNVRNVPEKHPWTTMGRYLGPVGVEQFFIKEK